MEDFTMGAVLEALALSSPSSIWEDVLFHLYQLLCPIFMDPSLTSSPFSLLALLKAPGSPRVCCTLALSVPCLALLRWLRLAV